MGATLASSPGGWAPWWRGATARPCSRYSTVQYSTVQYSIQYTVQYGADHGRLQGAVASLHVGGVRVEVAAEDDKVSIGAVHPFHQLLEVTFDVLSCHLVS